MGCRNRCRGPALLDIAQGHALVELHRAGLFERGLVFKGGTSRRKFRAGAAGRFSADLDFYAPDDDVTVEVMAMLVDAHVDGFGFRIGELDGDDRRADPGVDAPFGSLTVGSSLEVSQRPLILPVEWLS